MAVIFDTTIGEFTIDLYIDEVPLLAANFLKLCKLQAYTYSTFNRIEKNYLAEGGFIPSFNEEKLNSLDASIFSLLINLVPPSKYKKLLSENDQSIYPLESINEKTGLIKENIDLRLRFKNKGTVAMSQLGSHGSTFCISLQDNMELLNDKLSIIGYISENFNIIDKFNTVLTEDYISFKPLQIVQILKVTILDDPFPDPKGFELIKPFMHRDITPALKQKLESSIPKASAEADLNPMIEHEIEALEKLAKSEAKSRAVALEILGDLPDADLTPPDNCLFICKLNPVTEAEDLKLIFSRFGTITSCDIVYDWKTGDSLQYGFIQFEDPKACEAAIFKMEGTLIDDRRIHVDFCQSVSRQWNLFYRNKKKAPKNDQSEVSSCNDYVFKRKRSDDKQKYSSKKRY